ncbi:MAG: hypothetical protein BJ554DRAFT_5019 [Olpidium bornovanus]|uniref:Uncharacterized protein n=1 Tax=Olpidium bornovanus TaxID=278681 RepID=A0A8H7ZLW7_9FUNG|nr:MAG: hypothetical protein BJ554DRAFT_5019 [Olpidium bornovanus]
MADSGVTLLVAVIQAFVAAEGRFKRRNVTDYLRRFDVTVKSLRLADSEVASQFELTVHEDYDDQVCELTAGKSWRRANKAFREAFRHFDETRVTVERFVAWINGSKKCDDPDDILRGFDRRFGYLDATERTYFAEKTMWLLRAMPLNIRREAARGLRDGDVLTADWAHVADTIRNLSKVTRVMRTVKEAPCPSTSEKDLNLPPSTNRAVVPVVETRRGDVNNLCDRLEQLSLNFIAAIERLQTSTAFDADAARTTVGIRFDAGRSAHVMVGTRAGTGRPARRTSPRLYVV